MRKLFLLLLTILAVSMSAAAQTRTVRGIVISGDDNEPIVGASVMVVGTQLGSSTDVEGKFVIKNVPSDAKSLRKLRGHDLAGCTHHKGRNPHRARS